jgi:2-succinyl-5-enolpyruvyl-6-hydroxy-3-cyclohexene-1-carboxylate synthase
MPAENAGRAFALVVVDQLARHGVRHAVVAPGSRSTPIALALLENSHIAVHVRVDERSAAYLALGIARASGQVVPVLCTSGTAASYFHGAVMEADLSRVPLLVLTADRPPELHGIGANQTVEQERLYGGAARWAPSVPTPEPRDGVVAEWRRLVDTAVDHCLGRGDAPAGPVHLNLPLREPLVPVWDGAGFSSDLGLGAEPLPEPAEDRAVMAAPSAEFNRWIADARSGVIVCGDGGNLVELRSLAERAGWPVIAEPHSSMRQGEHALRSTDGVLRDAGFTGAHRPDLVVVAGRVGLSRTLLEWLATVPHIVVTVDGSNWDVTRSATAVLAVTPSAIATAALGCPGADPRWLPDWRDASDRVSAAVDRILDETGALTEPRVARDVADLVPDDSCLVVSSSMPIRDLDLVMRPRSGIAIHANRGVSGIDGFASTAMGVALGRPIPQGPVVALCGDLSLLHDVNGLMPGPDPRPDITFVVINNDGGGIFSLLPQADSVAPAAFERLWGTPHGMSIEKVAAAYDVEHALVETADQLAAALSPYRGVRMIEVRTDRAENAALHHRLRQITVSTS